MRIRSGYLRGFVVAALVTASTAAVPAHAQDAVAGPLIVLSAGSLNDALQQLLAAFRSQNPGVTTQLTTGGSVDAARTVTDSARVPDVFLSADDTIIPALLIPRYATWYAKFVHGVMVLAYSPKSKGADSLTPDTWVDVLTRPGVRIARIDASTDPGAYRTPMIFALAERAYHRPGLADTLLQHAPLIGNPGAGGSSMFAQFQSGAIDYLFLYRTSAASRHLHFIELPSSVNLGDRRKAKLYASVHVRIPSRVAGVPDTLEIRGSPVTYGLTIPRKAAHPAAAAAFVAFLSTDLARAVLSNAGFDVPDRYTLAGPGPVPPDVRTAFGH